MQAVAESRPPHRSAIDTAIKVLWFALLVSIPFTSHPLTAELIRWSPVSPLAVLPLIGLALLWLPQYLSRTRSVPKLSIPLLAFVLVVIVASLVAQFLPIYPAFNQTVFGRELRSMLTLGAGVAVYLVASTWPGSSSRLKISLRWLYIGGILLLLYSSFQIATLPGIDDPVPEPLIRLHRFFTVRDPLRARITGFAYEPSWLGNQLVTLYIPLWLGAVISGYSAFSRRSGWISLEMLLALWALVILFFSFARLAWISLFLIVGVLLIAGSGRVAERVAERFGFNERSRKDTQRVLPRIVILAIGTLGLLVVIAAVVFAASILDERVARILETDLSNVFSGRDPWPYLLANALRSGERLMYWTSGLRVFSTYPVIGVGLGNTGFLMTETMPAFGYRLPEIIQAVHLGEFGFPNPKSLWVRLLAETGIVGFTLFVTWLILLGVAAARLVRTHKGLARAIGLAALLALLAQITEGFSLDTFGLPHLWVMLGLLTAASQVYSARGRSA